MRADSTIADSTHDAHRFGNILKRLNLRELSGLLVYLSMALSLLVPVIYFSLFVYPAMTAYVANKEQLSSIPLLKQQVSQLKKLYENGQIKLIDLEANTLLPTPNNVTNTQYNAINLHRLAYQYHLTIIATDSLNEPEVSSRLADYFTINHLSWHLRGYFSDYLAFRAALQEQQPLLQPMREHLSTEANLKLNIVVDINVYQPTDVAL